MARRRRQYLRGRPKLPEGTFHVINRGVRKLGVFLDDLDRGTFVRLMAEFALRSGVWIIAWCLMPNHFHLEIRATGLAMVRFMHDLQLAYAKRFNRRHKKSGYLFQGRFRCIPITTPKGLAYVSRYIHGNSRDLGLAPESYGWSSCRSYLGIAPTPSWLHPEPVFEALRGQGRPDIRGYREYMSELPPKRAPDEGAIDEYLDLDVERVRRVEELVEERRFHLPTETASVSTRTLVCWVAIRIHGIPATAAARYFGYASLPSLHAMVSRAHKKLSALADLREVFDTNLF